MNSADNLLNRADDETHQVLEVVDTLQNLLHLIRLDASSPTKLLSHVALAETLLLHVRDLMSKGLQSNRTALNVNSKILIVDDEPSIVQSLGMILSTAGYETRQVESAEAALELVEIERWVPQLAIVDVHLPAMNGVELAIILKKRYPQIWVSLFSGKATTAEVVETARQRGHSFHVLPKPVHPSVFLGIAAMVVGNGSKPRNPH